MDAAEQLLHGAGLSDALRLWPALADGERDDRRDQDEQADPEQDPWQPGRAPGRPIAAGRARLGGQPATAL